jgi:putative transposase
MPNHWHLVLWPAREGELGAFLQKLTVTPARNWLEHHRKVGFGHVYQGRYKSFPVETDDYFYQVVRYVERNALRANLVTQAEQWRWSSLWRRLNGNAKQRSILGSWPLPRPRRWRNVVNEPLTDAELSAIHRSTARGQPYGCDAWVKKTAKQLGLESTLRNRGRPKKKE